MKPVYENIIRGVVLIAVISVVSLTIAHRNVQAQPQTPTGQNMTAAELKRDPGDMLMKDKDTPSQELKRDPGDLILNGTK